MGLSRGFYMTVYFDANNIYDAGAKAMQSSKFKHGTQLFEMNHLLTTAHIRRGFITGDYKPDPGNKFPINERGHPRYITSNTMVDKTVKGYGRYTDDSYAIARTREELLELLDGLEKEAKEYGLIINRKKTRIVKLSSEFRHLQVCYSLTETGRVVRKISPKNITRERRKLKAYKRLLDSGRIDYATVENAFKSWLGSHWKYMSHDQVYNMSSLYYELFGRRPKWKKGHGRLHWLMAHPSTASTSTGTTTSAPPSSPRPPSPVSSPA